MKDFSIPQYNLLCTVNYTTPLPQTILYMHFHTHENTTKRLKQTYIQWEGDEHLSFIINVHQIIVFFCTRKQAMDSNQPYVIRVAHRGCAEKECGIPLKADIYKHGFASHSSFYELIGLRGCRVVNCNKNITRQNKLQLDETKRGCDAGHFATLHGHSWQRKEQEWATVLKHPGKWTTLLTWEGQY